MDETKCFLDITIGGVDSGRITVKLFTDKCPKTCENFRCLCTGEKGVNHRTRTRLHYKGSTFHRIVRNFMIQAGDITEGNGKGGESIYEGSFSDENLESSHDEPYLLSMANRGPNTNKSQFFITTNEAPHLDGKHVIFGRVISGLDTILKIEKQEVDSKSRPLKRVVISDCGQLESNSNNVTDTTQNLNRDEHEPRTSASLRKSSARRRYSSSSGNSHSSSNSRASSSPSQSNRPKSRKRKSASSSSSESSRRRSRSRSSSSSSYSRSSYSTGHSSSSRSYESSSQSSRSSSSSSSSSSNSGSSSSSSSSRSSSDSSISVESYNSCDTRHQKRQKTNRRLESTRSVNDFKRDAELRNKEINNEVVNPHYRCSVITDEIPEVPVNRFLLRCPESSVSKRTSEKTNSTEKTSLSVEKDETQAQSDMLTNDASKSQVKVSKSGRIMKGRGSFKFRTPSPEQKVRDHGKYRRSSTRVYYHRSPSRYSRSRSRSRVRSRSISKSRSRSPRRRNYSSHRHR